MQINSQSSQFYPVLTTVDQRSQNNRLPVVYSAVEQFTSVVREQVGDSSNIVTPVSQNNEGQQARFVREFVSADRNIERFEQKAPLLPKALQTYQNVSQINGNKVSGNFVDETV